MRKYFYLYMAGSDGFGNALKELEGKGMEILESVNMSAIGCRDDSDVDAIQNAMGECRAKPYVFSWDRFRKLIGWMEAKIPLKWTEVVEGFELLGMEEFCERHALPLPTDDLDTFGIWLLGQKNTYVHSISFLSDTYTCKFFRVGKIFFEGDRELLTEILYFLGSMGREEKKEE